MTDVTINDVSGLFDQFSADHIEHMGWESRLKNVDLNDDVQLSAFIDEWIVPAFAARFRTMVGQMRCKDALRYLLTRKGDRLRDSWGHSYRPLKGIDDAVDATDYERRLVFVYTAIGRRLFGESFLPAQQVAEYQERTGMGYLNWPDDPSRWEEPPIYSER